MATSITWYGHSNFLVQTDGVSILIDPFFSGNPSAPCGWQDVPGADLLLVTHDHGDHVGDTVNICGSTGAMLGAVYETAASLVQKGVPQKQVVNGVGFNIGGTVEQFGVKITMTEAFHSSETGVAVGYILTFPDGFTIYHAGDTGLFSNMKILGELYKPDVALLPIGGVFTMDFRQAAFACHLLNVPCVIPMHYGTFPALSSTAEPFKTELAKLCPGCKAILLQAGEKIDF